MDISFHYYAVKATALYCGYNEADAQTIAGYSQYVDDYNRYMDMLFRDLPVYLKGKKFTSKPLPVIGRYWTLNPVSTGFSNDNLIDMGVLTDERHQKWIVIPFHFIPSQPLSRVGKNYVTRRVKIGDGSVLSDLLIQAKEACRHANGADKHYELIRIGALLHPWADSLAHEGFNGFHSQRNNAKIKVANKVDENGTATNVNSLVDKFSALPAIAHVTVGHVPDLDCLDFEINFPKANDYPAELYKRSNPTEYLSMAKEMMIYLRECQGMQPFTDDEWESFARQLKKCFVNINIDPLSGNMRLSQVHSVYTQQFPHYNFHYNAAEYMPHTTSSRMDFDCSEDFFRFNYYCDWIRTAIVGEEFIPKFMI